MLSNGGFKYSVFSKILRCTLPSLCKVSKLVILFSLFIPVIVMSFQAFFGVLSKLLVENKIFSFCMGSL